jgi:hypothetical protein
MKVSICKLYEPNADKVVFFNVFLEMPEIGAAIVLEGFRYYEGKIHPPTKPWQGKHYVSVLCSEKFAQLVQEALEAIGFTDPELEKYSYVSAKWGQAGLKRLCDSEELALNYWAAYREKK